MPDRQSLSDLAAAARWWLRRDERGAEEAEAPARWPEGGDGRSGLLDEISSTQKLARSFADDPAMATLREQARARAERRTRERPPIYALAASVVILLLGALAWEIAPGWWKPVSAPDAGQVQDFTSYETRIGQRQRLALTDGSVVHLDTDSRLRVAFANGERRFALDRGQAYFEVARDPHSRFVVIAHGHAITAHGTQFDVRLDADSLSVTLVEGHVSVGPVGQRRAPVTDLQPLQQFRLANGRASVSTIANVDQLLGWRDGLTYFDDTSLTDAVAEMNRYRTSRIVLADADLGRLRVSGAFNAGSDSFVQALGAYFPIRVVERTKERTVLGRRSD